MLDISLGAVNIVYALALKFNIKFVVETQIDFWVIRSPFPGIGRLAALLHALAKVASSMRVGFGELDRQRCSPTSTEPTLGLIRIEWEGVSQYRLIRLWWQSSRMCFLAAQSSVLKDSRPPAPPLRLHNLNVKVAGHPFIPAHSAFRVGWALGPAAIVQRQGSGQVTGSKNNLSCLLV